MKLPDLSLIPEECWMWIEALPSLTPRQDLPIVPIIKTVFISPTRVPIGNRPVWILKLGDPEAESLNDFELGWRYVSPKFQLNTNVYYLDFENQLVLTGQLDEVGFPIRTNSGQSYRLGLEVDASITLG